MSTQKSPKIMDDDGRNSSNGSSNNTPVPVRGSKDIRFDIFAVKFTETKSTNENLIFICFTFFTLIKA